MATLTQAQLFTKALETMEDDLRISRKQGRDFVDSLIAVSEEALAAGDKVALLGIVTLTPKGVPAKPKRRGVDPRTGEETTFDARPAKVRLTATVAKRLKDALPEATTKQGKALISEARQKAQAAAERREQREAEEAKATAKAERAAKRAAKSK